MKEIRSIRSTGVSSSNIKVSLKAKVIFSVLAAALLVMMVVGNHSA